MKTAHTLDMTKGNPFSILLRYTLPLFAGNLLQQLYNLADTSLAGHILGDQALAQIGATAALYSLIVNAAFGLNSGLALTVSRSFGAGDWEKLRCSVCWMTILSGGSAILMTLGFLLFRNPLLSLMRVPDAVLGGAMIYLTIILIGIPFTMSYNLEASLLRAVGNSITPLFFLLFSSLLNIVLDILFMKYLALEIAGAAIATVLSQGLSAVLGFLYIARHYPELHFGKKELSVEKRFILQMYTAGLSMALMSSIYNIGSVFLQSSINALGSVYIAAQTGARKLAEFFYIPGQALGISIATYTSQNYGAGHGLRIKKGIRISILLYGIWWIAALICTLCFSEQMTRMITGSDNRDVITNAALYLKINIPMIPPMAILVILRNALQGFDHPIAPLFCSGLELIGKVIIALFFVPAYGYFAVCVCEPITWVVCFLFILVSYLVFRKELDTNK